MEVGAHRLGGELVFHEQLAREVEHAGTTDAQAGNVDRVAFLRALQPGQLIGEGDIAFRRRRLQLGDQRIGLQVSRERESYGDTRPTDVLGLQRRLHRLVEGFLHPVGKSIGEDHAILPSAVVIFSSCDVTARTIEVNM